MTMAQLTVRGVPEDAKRELERRAKAAGLSVSRLLLNMIGDGTRPTAEEKARRRAALQRFVGMWTKEEADEFRKRIADMERVDKET